MAPNLVLLVVWDLAVDFCSCLGPIVVVLSCALLFPGAALASTLAAAPVLASVEGTYTSLVWVGSFVMVWVAVAPDCATVTP